MPKKIIVVLVIVLGTLGYAYYYWQNHQSLVATSYESCLAAPGSRIQESYPATCVTKSGAHFIQPIYSSDQDIVNLVKQNFPEVKSISSSPPKFGSNSYVDINHLNGEWRLRFYLGNGDCPAGCIDSHEWYFSVDSNYNVTKVGEYSRTFIPQTNSYLESGTQIDKFKD